MYEFMYELMYEFCQQLVPESYYTVLILVILVPYFYISMSYLVVCGARVQESTSCKGKSYSSEASLGVFPYNSCYIHSGGEKKKKKKKKKKKNYTNK